MFSYNEQYTHFSLLVPINPIESSRTSISVCLRQFLTTATFVLVTTNRCGAISPLSTLTRSSITDCSRYLHPLVSCQLAHLRARDCFRRDGSLLLFPSPSRTPTRPSTRSAPCSSTSRKSLLKLTPRRNFRLVELRLQKGSWINAFGLSRVCTPPSFSLPRDVLVQGLTFFPAFFVQPSSTSVRI